MITPAVFWDNIAETYAARPVPDPTAYQQTLDRIRAHLHPTDTVLELGCGTGSTALTLADAVAHYRASDISANMIAIGQDKAAKQGISNVTFVAADAAHPSVAGADQNPAFDSVLALNLLHLVPDLPDLLTRIHAMTRPGGLFISKTICLPEQGGGLKFAAMRAALPLMRLLGKAPQVWFYRIPQLETLIRQAGFDIIETGNYPANPPSRFIVARRL